MFTSTHKRLSKTIVAILSCVLSLSVQSIYAQEVESDLGFLVTGQEEIIPPGDMEIEAEDGTFIGTAIAADQQIYSYFTINNLAASPLAINEILIVGDETDAFFVVDEELEFPLSVAPESAFVFQIGFSPSLTGMQQAEVVIKTTRGDYGYAVAGNGVLAGGQVQGGQVDQDTTGEGSTFSPNLLSAIASLNSAAGLGGGRGFTPRSDFNFEEDLDAEDEDQDVAPPESPSISP